MRLSDLPSVFVTGTDTDAGKTWVSCQVLRHWQASGLTAGACKPVASGGHWQGGVLVSEDAMQLAAVTGQKPEEVATYVFEKPASPHIADTRGDFAPQVCLQRMAAIQANHHRLLVEGAGGWCVPLSEKMMQAELVRASGLPVVLVVPVRLGCINHALLSAGQIRRDGCDLLGWYANRIEPDFEDFETNVAAISRRIRAPRLID